MFTFQMKTIKIANYHKNSTKKFFLIILEKGLSTPIQNPEAIKGKKNYKLNYTI